MLFKQHAAVPENGITFEEFLAFMVERTQDRETPEQVREAFRVIAQNKVRRRRWRRRR